MAYLEWRDVAKSFGGGRALDGVSLSMDRGEILALLGPSGSGKTTLLRITCGLDRPDHGVVLREGADITDVPTHERSMGLMFQDYNLFPHLSVEGNVAFGLRMKRWPVDRTRARVREILKLVRLEDAGKRSVTTLSGGEKQRVALARSLAPSPSLLMLDEPFGALDAVLRGELLAELPAILRQAGATVLYVTHDRAEALAVADRLALINRGRIVQTGSPRDLMIRPSCAFTASFLGLGALVPAAVRHGRVETDIGTFAAEGLGCGGAATGSWPADASTDGGGPDETACSLLLIRPSAVSLPPKAGAAIVAAVVLSHSPGTDGTVVRLGLQGRQGMYEVSVRMELDDEPPETGSSAEVGLDVTKMMMLGA